MLCSQKNVCLWHNTCPTLLPLTSPCRRRGLATDNTIYLRRSSHQMQRSFLNARIPGSGPLYGYIRGYVICRRILSEWGVGVNGWLQYKMSPGRAANPQPWAGRRGWRAAWESRVGGRRAASGGEPLGWREAGRVRGDYWTWSRRPLLLKSVANGRPTKEASTPRPARPISP